LLAVMLHYTRKRTIHTGWMTAIILAGILLSCSEEPETFDELKAAGIKAYTSQSYAEARTHLTKAAQKKSSDRDLLYFLATCYQRDLILDSAFFYIRRADILFPRDREIAMTMYTIAPQVQEWQAALTAIETLIATGDDAGQYYHECALYNKNLGNIYASFLDFEKAKKFDSTNPTRYLELSSAAAAAESIPYALAIIDTAIQKFGEKDQFLSNKAVLFSFQQRFEESEGILRGLVTRRPESYEFKMNLANTLASQASTAKKKEALAIYMQIEPNTDPTWKVDSLITSLKEELQGK
jgi:tetratricopeptide (TPR) repeat protein